MKRLMIFIFLFTLISPVKSQKIDFFSEDLTFRLQKEVFEVDGLYYFRNNTDSEVRQTMMYPFPDVEKYGEITFISVHREGDTTSMLLRHTERGALFMTILQPNEEAAYHIIYRQKLKTNEARYIILTTQKWGKPFETAKYRLETPPNLNLTHISITPDSTSQQQSKRVYLWQRQNFMPEADFEFFFD